MGSCYGTPSMQQGRGEQERAGYEFEPLVLWQLPDPCKPIGSTAEAAASQPQTAGSNAAGSLSSSAGVEQPQSSTQHRSASSASRNGLLSGSGGPSLAASPPAGPARPMAGGATTGGATGTLRGVGGMSAGFGAVRGVAPELVRLQYREITPEDYEILSLLDAAVPKMGTTPPSTVSRLPCLTARECLVSQCHVCLCELSPSTRVVRLPCGHSFHPECISRWLTQCNGKCPLCLQKIDGAAAAQDGKPSLSTDCGPLKACREIKGQDRERNSSSQSQSPSELDSTCDRISSSTSQMNCDNLSTTAVVGASSPQA
eukprot:TRINITY_DN49050_c0_g1_i1.p1 TRINITY_DN49050_c0_g1~~TRINITY_DN49050_c0_g1_i1.p1  ORF type:complete len:314 (+),score=32.05 TRINITY_DN49050_c0_g1_i1:79-1020(+)